MGHKKQHHGGAWKVAYADFVTAMMALFMVLWLTSQDQKIKEAVERAFRNPFSSVTKESTGIIPAKDKDMQAVKSTTGNFDSASAVELTMLRRINQDLVKSLQSDGEDQGDSSVKLELTPEGLLINVFDRSHKPIFEPQSTAFTTYGDWVFSTLAWEISADRATAVRRKLIEHGVASSQIKKVAGFGATVPMPNEEPTSEINRRVSVFLNAKANKP